MSSPEDSSVIQSIASLSIVTTEFPEEGEEHSDEAITPRQLRFLPLQQASETVPERRKGKSKEKSNSGSETEKESSKMPSGSSSGHHSSSSSKKHGSSSKHQPKSDDWSDVTEPDERRRIQNRIAQRKFREKAREQKERQEREARNQELAGNSYQVPLPADFMSMGTGAGEDDQLSGVPWGGLNIQHMVAMGHESESRRGSRREPSDHFDYGGGGGGADSQFYEPMLMSPYAGDMTYGGDDREQQQQQQQLYGEEALEGEEEEEPPQMKGKGKGKRASRH